jgi:hypothetical protein
MTIELINAAANNQIAKLQQCLTRGDNVNFQENLYGDTALNKALMCGHEQVVSILLHCGANPTIPNYRGFTALDINDGTYHRFIDREFENQQAEAAYLMGNSFEDNYYYLSYDYVNYDNNY